MPIVVSDRRLRQSLRLEQGIWDAIDSARSKRAGSISRNTWITEAILDRLARDTATDENTMNRNA
jgi:hypothetical protein